MATAMQDNLLSAVKASLLLMPERFSAEELYSTVAGLSYTGENGAGCREAPWSMFRKNYVVRHTLVITNNLNCFQNLERIRWERR